MRKKYYWLECIRFRNFGIAQCQTARVSDHFLQRPQGLFFFKRYTYCIRPPSSGPAVTDVFLYLLGVWNSCKIRKKGRKNEREKDKIICTFSLTLFCTDYTSYAFPPLVSSFSKENSANGGSKSNRAVHMLSQGRDYWEKNGWGFTTLFSSPPSRLYVQIIPSPPTALFAGCSVLFWSFTCIVPSFLCL